MRLLRVIRFELWSVGFAFECAVCAFATFKRIRLDEWNRHLEEQSK